MPTRPFKSLLFVPASQAHMAARAHERQADAVILDMEDGVAEQDKPAARDTLASLVRELQRQDIPTLVRINALESGGKLDIQALDDTQPHALLIPKVTEPGQVLAVEQCWVASGRELATLQLLPMIECPKGLFQAQQIAVAAHSVIAMVFGSEDFAAAAGLTTAIDALAMPAQWVALAAAAAGVSAYGLPGALGNYHDMALFGETLRRAKVIGYCGSLCVHPRQVLLANDVFQPGQDDIEWAKNVVAQAGSGGATGGDVGMVDAPVLARAQAILSRLE